MRLLLVNHFYEAFARSWYRSHPGLASNSYSEQRRSFADSMFGGTAFEVAALRQLGHEADVSIVNVRPLQMAWAKEHGHRLSAPVRWRYRLRRGWMPWPYSYSDHRWIGQALLAQVEDFRPDAVHVQSMDVIDPALIEEIRSRTRLVVGQIAAPLPLDRALAGYDLIVSSLPNFVDRFRRAGLDAEWLPLAFDPSILERLGVVARTIAVSFVGSLLPSHTERLELLEEVGASVPIDVWTADEATLAPDSVLRRRLHGPAWGADMYRALAASMITVNTHIDIAEQYANNLRLYEATGLGALLITDAKVNLAELFRPDEEVVTYTSPAECVAKIRYYVDHPQEASRIAAAGQARTLRDHTWLDRMRRLAAMIETRL